MPPTVLTHIEPKATTRALVRRRTFEVHNVEDVMAVVALLKVERHTGPVIITLHMSQGGIREIHAEDRANI